MLVFKAAASRQAVVRYRPVGVRRSMAEIDQFEQYFRIIVDRHRVWYKLATVGDCEWVSSLRLDLFGVYMRRRRINFKNQRLIFEFNMMLTLFVTRVK